MESYQVDGQSAVICVCVVIVLGLDLGAKLGHAAQPCTVIGS
jgi:hypothetical protein